MGMGQTKYKYLKFISFKEVSQWYVEYYMNEKIGLIEDRADEIDF